MALLGTGCGPGSMVNAEKEVAWPWTLCHPLTGCLQRLFMSPGGSQPAGWGWSPTLLETSGFRCSWPPTITKAQSRVEVSIGAGLQSPWTPGSGWASLFTIPAALCSCVCKSVSQFPWGRQVESWGVTASSPCRPQPFIIIGTFFPRFLGACIITHRPLLEMLSPA